MRRLGLAWVVLACASSARAQSIDPRDESDGHARAPQALGPTDAPRVSRSSNVSVAASSELATYADSDHVYVFTPSLGGTIANVASGWSVSGRYLVDVVSAASADVVSTASPPFVEARHVGTLDAAYKPHDLGIAANAALSVEPDYTSVLAGGTLTGDFLDKSVTVLLGYAHMHDVAGRSGTPYSVFSRVLDRDAFKGGLSLVVDRATVVSFVADVLIEHGDPSKPYRYVPLFAPGVTLPAGASVDAVNRTRVSERALEQLPDTRQRYALTMRWAHRLARSTVRLDERAYVDSWGLKATTTDGRWYFDWGRRVEIGPHVRFYGQTPVDFWERTYTLDPNFRYPTLRTGNRELGPLVDLTGGASLRIDVGSAVSAWKWTLGADFDLGTTRYLDDLYLSERLSGVGSLSLEVSN